MILMQVNYKLIKSVQVQSVLLLASSYFFYGWWDWRFLGLIFAVSAQTYIAAYFIHYHKRIKNFCLVISILINLAVLVYFKYAGFFVSEFVNAFNIDSNFSLENIILPVGISFYIFQSFTYVIDVFSGKMLPEKDPIKYFTFISFFPQLVAGPIERASSLLPQFKTIKGIEAANFYTGLKIIIIGLFLKVFIADSIAPMVDMIFSGYQNYNGGTLLLGAIGFMIQIYGDFAGYSLIAIGVAKILGFSLMKNFNTPYFATSIQDFWRRWHISLSSFFRDYVYIPFGGSRRSEGVTRRNLLLTFSVSGLWHGANWTFVFWGVAHGLLLIFQRVASVSLHRFLGWLATMVVVLLLWVLFRSDSLYDFYSYVEIIIFNPGLPEVGRRIAVFVIYYFALDLVLLYYSEQGNSWFSSDIFESISLAVMIVLVVGTIHDETQNFIYFQF